MKQLNDIIDRMGELTSPAELYPAVCERLTDTPDSVALVLRLPPQCEPGDEPLPVSPKVLACRFGGGADHEPSAANLHLSRRVLEAAQSSEAAVMASNVAMSEAHMDLTLVDDRKPRAVFCAPLAAMASGLDVLYLDVPCDQGTEETLDFVRVVARQVSASRKSLLLAQARAERTVLDGQLELARRIQTGLTPAGLQQVPGAEVAVRYEPAMWVGGDYCDVWTLADGRVAIAVGDVSGKGLPAAMVMTNLQAALRATMAFCSQLGEVMGRVNALLEQNLPEEMFVTFFLGLFDPASGRLEYVNAGHLPPLTIAPPGGAGMLGRPGNMPLGIMDDVFRSEAVDLSEGGGLLVFTDGITEAASPGGGRLGVDRLQSLLEQSRFHSAGELAERVVEAAVNFRQTLPQQDDITVLALMRRGPSDTLTI
jgi:serine phosphatase RsbU (regulator of sigma subunit)